ncbi:hypothetical protein SEVIR_2G414650v4 [Setaria viridis]
MACTVAARPASSWNIVVREQTGGDVERAICMVILLQEPLLPNQGVIKPSIYIYICVCI